MSVFFVVVTGGMRFDVDVLFTGVDVLFVDAGRITMLYFMSMFLLVCVCSMSMCSMNAEVLFVCVDVLFESVDVLLFYRCFI